LPTSPTGNLDEATADDVLALARDLVARTGCGFLMAPIAALAVTLDRQSRFTRGSSLRRATGSCGSRSHWRHPMQLATLLIG